MIIPGPGGARLRHRHDNSIGPSSTTVLSHPTSTPRSAAASAAALTSLRRNGPAILLNVSTSPPLERADRAAAAAMPDR